MHVGILQAYFSRASVGGGEIHTEHLGRALDRRGHRVTICTDEPNEHRTGIEDLEVREFPTPLKLNPVNELALAHRAQHTLRDCDVVMLTDESAWLGVDLPIPTAMTFHLVWHGWVRRNGPLLRVLRRKPQALVYRWMERKIVRKATAIVAISSNMAEDIALVAEASSKIQSIPNGVDVDRFAPVAEKYDEFTVHFQGRLVEMKNPGLLIEAARRSSADWRLTIGGDGPLRDDLEARVAEYGLSDRVEFLGYVPNETLPERYARSHVYALPSTYEGMPLTVLEAAASGTAVLASPRAATDLVDDSCGWVVAPDADAIAATLDGASQRIDETIAKGNRARELAENYSWDAVAEQYEELFEKLVEANSTGP